MAIPKAKVAIYYGQIKLIDGSLHTYTAADVAALYNMADVPYLAVPLVGISPFKNGVDEVSYIRLKPQSNPGDYFDAKERYNYNEVEYYDDDFDAHAGGRWAVIPRSPDPDAP